MIELLHNDDSIPGVRSRNSRSLFLSATLISGLLLGSPAFAAELIHDAEHNILAAQHAERWANEDKEIDAKLAEIRKNNGGKSPNIVYILLDDLGFGEIGMPNLDVIRGYSTPRISQFADEGLSLQRMYTEPSCTPTRVAMMTGRYAARTGTAEAKATVAGAGQLALPEGTSAAVLREKVSSPGGTTVQALSVLTENNALEDLLLRAVRAAAQRSKELS
jgi:hypothetical protein